MKRGILAALVTCAGLSGACSSSDVEAGIAGLSGTYDLTLVNDLVFVTSSDNDELRVLDLSADPKQFIPAPNPLEALSIPVLGRPDALARDVGYSAEGADVPGPYVYARSSGSSEISVVAADRSRLVQVARLTADSLVTAFAARSPGDVAGAATSTLYYAMQDPDPSLGADTGGARVMRQDLPGPDVIDPAALPAPATVFCLEPGESIQSMVVLSTPGELAVATRRASGRSGRTLLITDTGPLADCLQPTAPTVDLSGGFGGVPVRLLATHPGVRVSDTRTLAPSQYVYGILDEVSCGGTQACSGVLAVDTTTPGRAERARDISNAPMLPIYPALGVPTGLTLVPDAVMRLVLDDGTGDDNARVPLLGIMPSSGGLITLFAAHNLRHFDLATATPGIALELRDRNEAQVTLETEGLVVVTQDPALQETKLYEGSVPNATYRIIYQGAIPGLSALARDANDPRRFEAEPDPAWQPRVGDLIVLESVDVECGTALTVAAVEPIPGTSRVRLAISDAEAIPAECESLPSFTVRAGGDQPFVLQDSSGAVLSRDVLGTPYRQELPTEYFFHPNDFFIVPSDGSPPVQDTAKYPQPPPPLNIQMTGVGRELERGDRYVVSVTSGVRNFVFAVDTSANAAVTGLAPYTLPGAVVASQAGGANLAYIVYPSADGILQVNLQALRDNVANSAAMVTFE
ncbi:hypothetical protein [Myxococcus sp. RHSTA-1-4]|uniref:hypothetical protein n=1 Tax=Myxococcus sp. RHSTA-1-4 TaxID=2874601 RepID=UPI001CBDFAA9